jgi:L,D-transpeptidase catalytic domain
MVVPLVLLLLLLALLACASGETPEEEAADEARELEERSAAAGMGAEARRSRGPWFDHVDNLARRYPVFGVTLHHMAYIYEAPKKDSRPIGYLRRGARFRAGEEVTGSGCSRGWFEIAGGGYVCAGEQVSVDSQPPAYAEPPVLPVLSDALPYRYLKNATAELPQFVRLPSPEEERAAAGTSSGGLKLNAAGVPVVDTAAAQLAALVRLRMQPGFYVSVDREIEAEDRRFVRTVRGGLVRAEQLAESKQPAGLGVAIGSQFTLPLAFVYRAGTPSLRLDPISRELVKAGGELPLHGAHALTGESIVKAGRRYFMTRAGLFLRDTGIRIVDRVPRPRPVPRGERWIRVDLDRQTLTAYEGETPVFATLVSSGLPDHATPVGMYRLHAKHVSTTMDDLATDGPYSIEDVPWTMYFLGSYALHAAFWHDRFGNQRSHGCVNLAPRDARWLFFWTLPELPSSWHGVLAGVGQGTTIVLDSGVAYALEQGT